jgi:hypothetical protein
MELKEYCRFHFKLKSKVADLKKCSVCNMQLIFTGSDQIFSSLFTKTSIAILKEAPRPSDILEMGEERLFELMKITSRNYYSPDKTGELLSNAKHSILRSLLKGSYCSDWNSYLS